MTRKTAFAIHLVGLAIGVALLYPWLASFFTKTIADDIMEFGVPFHTFVKTALAQGHFPLWNPYVQAGTPHLPSVTFDFFYPLHWLIYLFPITIGINVMYLLHWTIGWAGTYLFFRTFAGPAAAGIGAWAFMLSRPLLNFIQGGYLETFYTVVLMPWCLWFLHRAVKEDRRWHRRAWAALAGVLAAFCLTIVVTYTQVFLFLPAALYLLCLPDPPRRRWEALLIFVGLAGMGSACRILPWYLLSFQTQRSTASASLVFSAAGSVHPMYLLDYLVPSFLPNLADAGLTLRGYRGMPWPMSFGVIPLFLFGRAFWGTAEGKWLTILYLAVLSLVLGIYSPVFLLCFYLIPGFSLTSHPTLYTWVLAFAGAGCVAIFVHHVETVSFRAGRYIGGVAILMALSVLLLFFLPVESRLIEYFLNHREGFSPAGAVRQALVFLKESPIRDGLPVASVYIRKLNPSRICWALTWAAFLFGALKLLRGTERMAAVALLVAADVCFHPIPAWNLSTPENYFLHTRMHEKIETMARASVGMPFRIYPVGGPYNTPFFKFNQGCLLNVESIKGESTFLLSDAARYFSRVEGWPLSMTKRYAQLYGVMKRTDSRLLDLLNVKVLISDTPLADRDLKEIGVEDGLYLYENVRALPRAFLSRQIRTVDSVQTLFETIERDTYDPRQALYTLEAGSAFRDTAEVDPAARVEFRRDGPNTALLNVGSGSGGWGCLSEVYVPGWKAVLDDGAVLPIVKVNGLFRAVWIPSGTHQVVFSYVPEGLKAGLLISGVGIMMALGLCFMAVRER